MSKLEIDSVTKAFGDRVVLKDIYLKCETGEVVGLIGRNGSGKSTLMKILFGAVKGESQSVRIDGNYVSRLFEVSKAAHYLPQDGLSMEYLSFDQLVKLFHAEKRLPEMLQIKEVYQNRAEKVGNLSGGMKKLIEALIVINAEAKFCLLDEPFSFLAPVMAEKVIEQIRDQSARKGILLTDHMSENVFRVCTRHYLLYSGSLRQITQLSQLEEFGYKIDDRKASDSAI